MKIIQCCPNALNIRRKLNIFQKNDGGSASNGGSDDALDYSRCYSNSQSKSSSQSEVIGLLRKLFELLES